MQTRKLSALLSVLTGAVLLTGCPDDGTSNDTDATTSGGDDDGSAGPTTMPPTTMPPTTDPTMGMTGDDTTGTPMTDTGMVDTGMVDTGMTDTGMTDTGMTDTGMTTGVNACVDENIGNTVPQTTTGTSTGAGDDFVPTCTDGNSDDYVLEFTAPADGAYIFDTEGSAIDTVLMVFEGCDSAELACNDDGPGDVLCGDFACSQVAVNLTMGQTVLVVVDGYDVAGDFTLNISEAPPPPDDGYGDCSDDTVAGCPDGEVCLFGNNVDDMGTGIAVCAYDFCTTAMDCPDAPATGDAPVACSDPGLGEEFCILDCAGGETCPDGMECFDLVGICVFETPAPAAQDGGSCCVDSTGGTAGTGDPGCDVAAVQDCVCGINVGDPFCCETEWDATCVTEAQDFCNATCN